jgi:Fic family protein
MAYHWELADWPDFRYDEAEIAPAIAKFTYEAAQLIGAVAVLPGGIQLNAIAETLVQEAIKTSAVEGQFLSREDVMFSIQANLGIGHQEVIKDKNAKGIADLMVLVRNTYSEPLSEKALFEWHKHIFPKSIGINVGEWRSGQEPMQIVSGTIGKESVHYVAPPSHVVPSEMDEFIRWFNDTAPGGSREISSGPIRAAIAHLYFESIHPFEDGNGRIGRALAEKAIAQNVGQPLLLSISSVIEANRGAYYKALQTASLGLELTPWINYFIQVLIQALKDSRRLVALTLAKTRFFDRYANKLNARQHKVITKMLNQGVSGFEGGMNARKYSRITGASKATATRDLQDLREKGILILHGGGRSTRYELQLEE